MYKKKNCNKFSKVTFICSATILAFCVEANYSSSKVEASEATTAQTSNQDVKPTDSVTDLNKDKPETQNNQVEDTTKVVIHYQGDGSKWVPYVWGKKPNGSGSQYNWDGKDENGYYANINVSGNEQEVGILIKNPSNWDKDGEGNDRVVTVDDSGKAEVFYKEKTDESQKVEAKYDSTKLDVHYYNKEEKENSITGQVWTDGDDTKKEVALTGNKEFTGSLDLSGAEFSKIFFLGSDGITREFTALPGGKTSIYLTNDDKTAYYTASFALASDSLTSASMISGNTIQIETGKKLNQEQAKDKLQFKDNEIVDVKAVDPDENGESKKFVLTTEKDLDILNDNQVGINDNYKSIDIGNYVRSKEFDDKYYYDGNDLGALYADNGTQIKLWAPTAKNVTLNLYNSLDNSATATKTYAMTRSDKGVWTLKLDGDYRNWAYDYSLLFGNGKETVSIDPYAKAVTINGERAVIADYDAIKPDNFDRLPEFSKPTDAIIYETSVRDFTSDPNSGIEHKGKFLGMIESGKTQTGQVTGLDYLKSLGITHVQIMPSYDFASLDESSNKGEYNWGYDPKNYNVPEGSYATDPANPESRILEMKEMINGLHKAGIRVVMDVVYNHVFAPDKQALDKTVPGYYFQYDDEGHTTNGTGVGNDVASERKMARKYIVDSIKYWVKNYNIDGFRFDLMGILDVDTMNEIRSEVNKIDPGILIYGEGWDMRKTNHDQGAAQYNADKLDDKIGFFSDGIRNAIKGPEFGGLKPGLVEGNGQEDNYADNASKFIAGFLGGVDYGKLENHPYLSPNQTINYVACHDNRTLYDMIKTLMPNESEENIIKRDKLATSMALLAQGVPFIHSGQEALRTKNGDDNSYNKPIEINQIDWNRVAANKDTVDYFKKLLQVRKNHSSFRQSNYGEIAKNVKVVENGTNGLFAFEYQENGKQLYVIFNVKNENNEFTQVDLSNAKVLLSGDQMSLSKITNLAPLSTLIVEVSSNSKSDDETDSHLEENRPDNYQVAQTEVAVKPDVLANMDYLELELTHNAFVYLKDGVTVAMINGNKQLLTKGSKIKALNQGKKYSMNGKLFYQIADNGFVKVANTVKHVTLKHNAFIYSRKGKALKNDIKHVVLKKGKKITLLDKGKITTIKGKKFYRVGLNQYIKVANASLN